MFKNWLNSIYIFGLKLRQKNIDSVAQNPFPFQGKILNELIQKNANTEFGLLHKFKEIYSYQSYKEKIPLQDYESLKPFIERILAGEQNILCHRNINLFAKSSGTTDKSKFIPLTMEMLEKCHFKGGKDMLTLYFKNNSNSKLFLGKNLVISGTFVSKEFPKIGDVSAHIVSKLPDWIKYFRVPNIEISELKDWEEKLNLTLNQIKNERITCISGVPSWILLLLQEIGLDKKERLKFWENLEVYFHGGVPLTPFKDKFDDLLAKKILFMELYNASEGFFGLQDDLNRKDIMLLCNHGIYYEFYPIKNKETVVNLEEVKIGEKYAIVISTIAGLWRYDLGDVIEFTSLNPFRFIICGRTKQFINIFGEELMVHNADRGIELVCREMELTILNYTVAPKLLENQKGVHKWLIEFEKAPDDIFEFEKNLDAILCEINSDYEAKRQKNLLLQKLEIIVAESGSFYRWLQNKNSLGGQYKVPKMTMDLTLQNEIINV